MNKLAPIALILLFFFGGSLWYLANSELNANIKARIIQVSDYYTEQALSIDNVAINLAEGTGEIYGLKLQNSQKYKNKAMLTIDQVNFTFDSQSLTGKVISLESIQVKGSKFFIEDSSNTSEQNNINQLYQLLNKKIALIQDRRKQKSETYIQVQTIALINIEQSHLSLTPSQSTNTKIMDNYNLAPIGKGDGLPASLFGIEVLRKILESVIIPSKTKVL